MTDKQNLLENNKYLFWDIPHSKISQLSDKAIMERFLNYSKNMSQVLQFFELLGISNARKIFKEISSSKRPLISQRTLNYFSKYFSKYG